MVKKVSAESLFLSVIVAFGLALPLGFAASKDPTVNVKDLSVGNGRQTSITIRKGKPAPSQRPEFSVLKDTQEVEGDPSVSEKEARANWKSACAEWKTETKELNKKNEVLTLDCGRPTLSRGESGQKSYTSNAKYQIKVRMRSYAKAEDLDDDDEDENDGD